MSELIFAAQQGDATAMARLGTEAFAEGRLVEAAYWMVMADLRGFHNLDGIIFSYVETWRQMGCPEQTELTSDFFTEEQRQFGMAALLWISCIDRIFARNWFSNAARAGNYDARDFTMFYCSRG